MVGILAKVSNECANVHINITEVTQSILQDLFAMIMLVDISNSTVSFEELVDRMNKLGQAQNLKIHVMHEDIFNSMHRI